MGIIQHKYVYAMAIIAVFSCGYNCDITQGQVVLTNKISAELRIALGQAETTYVSRIKSVHKLGRDLNQDEKNAIYDFLEKKPEAESLPILEFDGIKNELVIVLMKQNQYPVELTSKLIKMYSSPELGGVWRDYCIQFLGQWGNYTETADELNAIHKTLKEALKERNGGIAGTALIALNSLSEKPGFSMAEIKDAAWTLASDSKISEASRVPALQISAVMGDVRIAETSRKIIAEKNPAILKMSAMATLGLIGSPEDVQLLQKYTTSSDIRLRSAATAAIKTLNDRGVATAPKTAGN